MNREQIIATLRAHEPELRQRGGLHASLFGSVARLEASAGSDVDFLIALAPDASIGLFACIAITRYLADLFRVAVDVANRDWLKSRVRPSIERDAVYAF